MKAYGGDGVVDSRKNQVVLGKQQQPDGRVEETPQHRTQDEEEKVDGCGGASERKKLPPGALEQFKDN